MTNRQKLVFFVMLATALAAGICEMRRVSTLRSTIRLLQERQKPLADRVQQLTRDHAAAVQELSGALEENRRLSLDAIELPRLREEANRLQAHEDALLAAIADPPKFSGSIEAQMQARHRFALDGRLLMMKERLQLTPEQLAAAQIIVERSKQDRDSAGLSDVFKDLKALLTPEQLKQYEELRDYCIGMRRHYTEISDTAREVAKLALELGLTREQQDKAYSAFAEWHEAQRQDQLSHQSNPSSNNAMDSAQITADAEYWINRRTELLRNALSNDQFEIYQRYSEEVLKAARIGGVYW